MNNKYLDWLTLISFGVGIYSLYIALENLEMNDKQNGEFIKEWENASQVKRELGFCAENIRSVCNGRRNQANGFKWKYKEE